MILGGTILSNLISDESYMRTVLPFLREDYFSLTEHTIFKLIRDFIGKYNTLPTKEALVIEASKLEGVNEKSYKELIETIEGLSHDPSTDRKYLIDQTETYCQESALIHALRKSIAIVDDPTSGPKSAIPGMLQDALAVCFDERVGHDYFENAQDRFDDYHSEKVRIPFNIDLLNKIYDGGLLKKTMLVLMGGTGVGKSLVMSHMAATNLTHGKNVLYLTMEMSELQIGQRIDHNLLGITKDELMELSGEQYAGRLSRIRSKTLGKLIVKEFPSGSASANHFRYVLNELRLKKSFVPDIIYVDYLNICTSSRMKMGGSINTFVLVKSIAEELRGLAQEFDLPLVTATQSNRDGLNSSDMDLTNTSESVGIPFTADYMLALITSEELEQTNQVIFKQLKNRYGDPTRHRKFVVGIDRPRMRLYNVEDEAQEDVVGAGDTPLMDRTTFGEQDYERKRPSYGNFRNGFAGFS